MEKLRSRLKAALPFLKDDLFGGLAAIFALPALGFLMAIPMEIFHLPWLFLFPFIAAPIIGICVVFRRDVTLRSYPEDGSRVFGWLLAATLVCFTLDMVISRGEMTNSLLLTFLPGFPLLPLNVFTALFQVAGDGALVCIGWALLVWLASFYFSRRKPVWWKALICVVVLAVFVLVNRFLFVHRPSVRYAGHGFDYMHGYSSTDFADYTVYSEPSKLIVPEVPFTISDPKEMPVLDGAEACYPLYAGLAKGCYENIADLEREAANTDEYTNCNGRIVSFTNTVVAFRRLCRRQADLIFGANLSADQRETAQEMGVDPAVTQIGREGFVFFVEADNPLEGLTSEQLREIYAGKITNWKEVGGRDEKIVAFQRPKNSGSQTMMEFFMGETALKAPMTYEVVNSMLGVLDEVAQYANEDGALGYTFRYFLEELQQEKGVKMLAVDGVYPTVETIRDGTYPLTVGLYAISRADEKNPNVQRLLDYLLSPAGQAYIEQVGYAGVRSD